MTRPNVGRGSKVARRPSFVPLSLPCPAGRMLPARVCRSTAGLHKETQWPNIAHPPGWAPARRPAGPPCSTTWSSHSWNHPQRLQSTRGWRLEHHLWRRRAHSWRSAGDESMRTHSLSVADRSRHASRLLIVSPIYFLALPRMLPTVYPSPPVRISVRYQSGC